MRSTLLKLERWVISQALSLRLSQVCLRLSLCRGGGPLRRGRGGRSVAELSAVVSQREAYMLGPQDWAGPQVWGRTG